MQQGRDYLAQEREAEHFDTRNELPHAGLLRCDALRPLRGSLHSTKTHYRPSHQKRQRWSLAYA